MEPEEYKRLPCTGAMLNWKKKNSGFNVIPLALKRVCYGSVYIERSQGWETPNADFSHLG